jgi:hypothetical protein
VPDKRVVNDMYGHEFLLGTAGRLSFVKKLEDLYVKEETSQEFIEKKF